VVPFNTTLLLFAVVQETNGTGGRDAEHVGFSRKRGYNGCMLLQARLRRVLDALLEVIRWHEPWAYEEDE
jgi:hypothetical protein